ncbi:MAG: hypothetical protein AB7O96_18595 [Pseudobdellovibrionaceae bacterium]
MKFTVPHFRPGDLVEAHVEEAMAFQQLVVSLHGDLIRVKNTTSRTFQKGDSILLIVSSTNPLQFQLYQPNSGFRKEWTI